MTVREILNTHWNIEEMTGYKPKTTFWTDFSIADCWGVSAIKDTFNRAFKEWKKDYIYLTELILVLNHKTYQWKGKNEEIKKIYNQLWVKADEFAFDNLKNEELEYLYQNMIEGIIFN